MPRKMFLLIYRCVKFMEFFLELIKKLKTAEATAGRFNQIEILEMHQNAKRQNLEFLWELIKIKELSAFDISFLMQNIELDEEKIKTLKKALKLYNPEDFKLVGQTLSDFIFRIESNLNILNSENLANYKEIIQNKNEIYDLENFIRNRKNIFAKRKVEPVFAFERVLY